MAQPNHPPYIADAAGSAGVSTTPAAGGAPPKDLFANRATSQASAAPAGTLPGDLFPNRPQKPHGDKPGAPDAKSVVPGGTVPTKDTPAPGTSTARTLSQPKPFKLNG